MSSCPFGHAWHTCATAIARGASKSSAEASQPNWTRAGGAVYRWHSLPWCTGTFPGACTKGASSSQVSSEAMLPVPPAQGVGALADPPDTHATVTFSQVATVHSLRALTRCARRSCAGASPGARRRGAARAGARTLSAPRERARKRVLESTNTGNDLQTDCII